MDDMQAWNRGDWMQTYSGRRFYPLDPHPEDIDHQDIAHALSLICRYGGHVDRFYSVAEHCVLMSFAVARENALAALMHDATEAYVGDMVRPLKRQIPQYQDFEARVWAAIVGHWPSIPFIVPAEVKEADNRILLTERDALMPRTQFSWLVDGMEPLPVSVIGWRSAEAEENWLQRFDELMPLRVEDL